MEQMQMRMHARAGHQENGQQRPNEPTQNQLGPMMSQQQRVELQPAWSHPVGGRSPWAKSTALPELGWATDVKQQSVVFVLCCFFVATANININQQIVGHVATHDRQSDVTN